jgi:uncharacterized membrane protein YdjX (TVP38/TMEM64 family)
MLPSTRGEWAKLIVGVALLGTVIGVTVWLTLSGQLQQFAWRVIEFCEDKEEVRDYLRSWGAVAPVVFMLMQALQVVLAPIPGEITGFVGGFVFGTWPSVVYSTVGLTLGSAMAFTAARIMGFPLVKLVVKDQTLEKFHFVMERRGVLATLILFTIPGFPKDILSYLLGLSPMTFTTFVIVCGLGRIPGTVMLSLSGAALYKENWHLVAGLGVVCVILLIVLYFKGERIRDWVKEKIHPHHDKGS